MASIDFGSLALPLGIILGFAILLSLGAYLYYRWNKARLKRLKEEGEEAPPERAENEIARVKGIERVMAEQGVDTSAALAHIAGAERRLRDGDVVDALARAKLAKEALMEAKAAKKTPVGKAVDLLKLPPPAEAKTEAEEKTLKEQLMEKVPKNFLESRFAIDSAGELVKEMPAGKAREEAEKGLAAAKGAFDSEDYDRAFTLGCKARRLAGAQSVFVSEGSQAAGAGSDRCIVVPEAPSASDVPVVITKYYDRAPVLAEEPADAGEPSSSGAFCASCGAPAKADDKFCRKCGTRLAVACTSCGKEALDGDKFCRGCGTKMG